VLAETIDKKVRKVRRAVEYDILYTKGDSVGIRKKGRSKERRSGGYGFSSFELRMV